MAEISIEITAIIKVGRMMQQNSVRIALVKMTQVTRLGDFWQTQFPGCAGCFTFSPNTSKGSVMAAATRWVSLRLNKLDKKE